MSYELIWIITGLALSIIAMILLNRYLNLHPFFSLLCAAMIAGLIIGESFSGTLVTMQTGFGYMLQQIGFIVALGSCLGSVLENTGAMAVISRKIMQPFGARRSVAAMTILGVIIGIPVFCDSAFIILSRLIPSLAAQTAINPAQLALALSTGLYTTHTLVPPTPGPLAAAANMGLADDLGPVILIGVITSIPVAIVSYIFSLRLGRSIVIPPTLHNESEQVKKISAFRAFLPLALPIILIACGMLPKMANLTEPVNIFLSITGLPVIALSIGLIFAFTLVDVSQKHAWQGWISDALKDAGIILLITGAGGAFGSVIKSSGIDVLLQNHLQGSQSQGIIFLVIGFVLAAILKTAQGSTTSSLIITSSLLAPLAVAGGFTTPVHLSILITAIGGGAMTASHANDSYFWVVSQFSGMTTRDTFRSFTVITFAQGVTALITSIILFILL